MESHKDIIIGKIVFFNSFEQIFNEDRTVSSRKSTVNSFYVENVK